MHPARSPALPHALAWVSLGNLISKGLMLLATIFVANRVREAGFGALNVAFTVVSYLSLFAFAGVDTITTREAAALPRSQLASFAGQVVWLRVLIVTALLVIAGALSTLLDEPTGWLTRLYALSFIPQVLYTVNLFYGVEWSWPITVYFIGGRVAYVLLLLFVVGGPDDLARVPLAFGTAIALENSFLFVLWLARYGCVWRDSLARLHWWRWRAAVPVSLAMAGMLLHENAALFVVYILRGAAEAGIYSAAFRLVYVAISLTQLCSYVYLARLTRVAQEHGRVKQLYRHALLAALVLGAGLAAAGTLLARPIVQGLYRAEYRLSAQVLAWGVWQMALAPVRVIAFQTITASRAHRVLTISVWGGVGASLLTITAAAHWRGAAGAALGTVVGETILALLLACVAWQQLPVFEQK
ncbi:MAG: oligosaccharide flippase family protein [bacterium]|nr:oligosaccharide flippase family protein [bacterium]